MKFLIINHDYDEFLCWLYAQHPRLEKKSYEEQKQLRMESLFGVADFYSSNLLKLGHKAWDIHVNNQSMQRAWAREHGIRIAEQTPTAKKWGKVLLQTRTIAAQTPLRYFKSLFHSMLYSVDMHSEFYTILSAQIKHYKPDILLNQAMGRISNRFLREMRPHIRLLVGQIASPLPQTDDFSSYNLVISSLPNLVQYFHELGLASELNRLAFEPRVLKELKGSDDNTIPVSFVGSSSQAHSERTRLLEYLCQHLGLQVWGQGIDNLSKNSAIRKHHMGAAWGIEMYRVLHRSKATLNHHIDVASSYANNMRLYEATGVGTLLVTDWKVNLHEIFQLGKEVVAYRSSEECAELIEYYLQHDQERQAIARAGQERTLKEHTYFHRMQELVRIVDRYV